VPSTAGKTFGTTINTDYSALVFWLSDQANAAGAGIGVQSGTVQLWGVQLEVGSVATPLEKLDPVLQLQQCQRFYLASSAAMTVAMPANAAMGFNYQTSFPVPMRAAPTIAFSNTIYGNAGSIVATAANIPTTGIIVGATALLNAAATSVYFNTNFSASADL